MSGGNGLGADEHAEAVRSRASLLAAVAALAAATVLTGCLGLPGPSDEASAPGDDPGATASTAADLPPGCDRGRSAVAHHPGADVVPDPEDPVPTPCLTRTGEASFEPTMGVDAEGNVYLHPSGTGDAIEDSGETDPVGVAKTADGGATWETILPQAAGVETHPVTLDPYLHLDRATGRLFVDDLSPAVNCSFFSWTDDGGDSWNHSVAGCMETDHQNVFTGPPRTSPTVGYPNIVYRCGINTVATALASTSTTCQRSLDGGRTWLPPGEPAFVADPREEGHMGVPGLCDGGAGHGTTGPEGVVYLPKGLCGQPWLAISDDEGLTWERVQVAENGMAQGHDANGYHLQAHEAGVGVDPEGNVYYLWVAEDRLPYLATSTDGGETWSDPMMVGAPGVTQAALPALMVGDVGEVALAYMGSTNAPEGPYPTCGNPTECGPGHEAERDYGNVTWNGYIAQVTDALSPEPTVYSAPVNDPADPLNRGRCGPVTCNQVHDFIDVTIGPDGSAWAPFVDGCKGPCVAGEEGNNASEGVAGRLWGGPAFLRQAGGS